MSDSFHPFGHLCILTREQYEEMKRNGAAEPSRFMGKSYDGPAALHKMRHLATFFNDVCVWDVRHQRLIGMCTQAIPLVHDNIAPPFVEFVLENQEHTFTIRRRPYAYPHPSGSYER